MNKLRTILIFIAIISILSGCSAANATNESIDGLTVEFDIPHANTNEEYLALIEKYGVTEDFVSCDDLAPLGSFKSIVLTDYPHGGITHYRYALVDDNGWEFSLYVYHDDAPSYAIDPIEVSANELTDMWENPLAEQSQAATQSCIVYVNDCIYWYTPTGFLKIMWEANGIFCVLTALEIPATEESTPVDTSALLYRLMDLDTVYEATEELYNMTANRTN